MINNYSCLQSPIDLRDYRLRLTDVLSAEYPKEFKVDMLHRIKNQRSICSCVAHALASILEYYDGNKSPLSTNFIYGIQNKVFGTRGPGMFIRLACKIALKYGDMDADLCPGNTEVDKVYELAEKAFADKDKMDDAYKHKLKGYFKIRSTKELKYTLMKYGPVIASVKWYDNYVFNNVTKFIVSDKKGGYGRHAIVIYGWDDSGWYCQNSWGSNWGNNGLFKLHFEDGPDESFGLVDDESLSSMTDIVNPTYNIDLLDILFKFINNCVSWIAKIFTKTL